MPNVQLRQGVMMGVALLGVIAAPAMAEAQGFPCRYGTSDPLEALINFTGATTARAAGQEMSETLQSLSSLINLKFENVTNVDEKAALLPVRDHATMTASLYAMSMITRQGPIAISCENLVHDYTVAMRVYNRVDHFAQEAALGGFETGIASETVAASDLLIEAAAAWSTCVAQKLRRERTDGTVGQ